MDNIKVIIDASHKYFSEKIAPIKKVITNENGIDASNELANDLFPIGTFNIASKEII